MQRIQKLIKSSEDELGGHEFTCVLYSYHDGEAHVFLRCEKCGLLIEKHMLNTYT